MLAKPLRSVEATTSYILSLSIKLIVQILLSFLLYIVCTVVAPIGAWYQCPFQRPPRVRKRFVIG